MLELLEKEQAAYEEHKTELLGRAKGKFVLIKDNKVEDVFDSNMDAIRQGYERFGNVPFLVKRIQELEKPLDFTSNLLGV